jgi:hypothetical protein
MEPDIRLEEADEVDDESGAVVEGDGGVGASVVRESA